MTQLDLGLIGNSRTSALIDRTARIVWWCYPHFDSNPMCCSLLHSDEHNASAESHGFIDLQFDNGRMAGLIQCASRLSLSWEEAY